MDWRMKGQTRTKSKPVCKPEMISHGQDEWGRAGARP